MSEWPIYNGTGVPHDGIRHLPDPPNWRTFDGGPPLPSPQHTDPDTVRRLGKRDGHPDEVWVPPKHEIEMVNAALFLRRPLLITGRPGTGKSTLAYSVAEELKLGPVLRWPITSRSTLLDGLYKYDAIGRLRDENLRQLQYRPPTDAADSHRPTSTEAPKNLPSPIGRHLRLGPLGTALLPYDRPRVLLIDEIDKSDIDLPNDLLNVFEEGEYEIDELTRLTEEAGAVRVMTADRDGHAEINHGRVRCLAFPFVILTSNAEREFPPAFLRRCLHLNLQPPSPTQVAAIVVAHLGQDAANAARQQVAEFLSRRTRAALTTDQLLNAIYIATSVSRDGNQSRDESASLNEIASAIMQPLFDAE